VLLEQMGLRVFIKVKPPAATALCASAGVRRRGRRGRGKRIRFPSPIARSCRRTNVSHNVTFRRLAFVRITFFLQTPAKGRRSSRIVKLGFLFYLTDARN